jgi:hypothetical protein
MTTTTAKLNVGDAVEVKGTRGWVLTKVARAHAFGFFTSSGPGQGAAIMWSGSRWRVPVVESPLAEAGRAVVAALEANDAAIDRIEQTVARLGELVIVDDAGQLSIERKPPAPPDDGLPHGVEIVRLGGPPAPLTDREVLARLPYTAPTAKRLPYAPPTDREKLLDAMRDNARLALRIEHLTSEHEALKRKMRELEDRLRAEGVARDSASRVPA